MKLAGKDIAAATDLVGQVLEGDARNADGLALRAAIKLEQNQVDSAITDLREALSQQPDSAPLLQLLGRAHELQGAVDLAEDRYAQAVRQANYSPALTLAFIAFLNRRGKAEQAEQVLTEAVARVPNNPRLLTTLAQARLARQDWEGAEMAANALRNIEGAGALSNQIVATSQLGRGNVDESIASFKELYTQSQGGTRPLAALVGAYIRSGRTQEARDFLETVLRANPDNAEAIVMRGAIATLEKNFDQAEAQYKLAVERQPDRAAGYLALGRHYAATGNLENAEAWLRSGIEKQPDDLSLAIPLAGVLEARKDFESAIGVYEGILEKRPDALVVINNLASLLADYRQDAESLERAGQLSLKLQSTEVPQFKDTLGWVAYRRGEYRAALSYLEEAVRQLPERGLVRYHLGMTLAKLERYGDAEAELSKALELMQADDPLKPQVETALAEARAKSPK